MSREFFLKLEQAQNTWNAGRNAGPSTAVVAATFARDDNSFYCATHPAMGTEYSLYLYAHSLEEAGTIAKQVFQEVDRVDGLLSNYQESSELSRINREAFKQEVTTDPETFRFLETCMGWSERSHGAFDISVGKLMKVWKFFGASGALPSPEELAAAREDVGWEKIRLDSARRTVRFLSSGIELDPGGVGKGYAVDRAVRVLRAQRVDAALLSAGSSTIYALGAPPYALGAPPGEAGWKVRVPGAGAGEDTISTVILRDTSLSTANLSEKHFIHDGRFYGAIMDPRTLQPVEGTLQVTVISPLATDSDALSNALFVSGTEDRAALLDERRQDCALVIIEEKQFGEEKQREHEKQFATEYQAIRWPADVANGHFAELASAKES